MCYDLSRTRTQTRPTHLPALGESTTRTGGALDADVLVRSAISAQQPEGCSFHQDGFFTQGVVESATAGRQRRVPGSRLCEAECVALGNVPRGVVFGPRFFLQGTAACLLRWNSDCRDCSHHLEGIHAGWEVALPECSQGQL